MLNEVPACAVRLLARPEWFRDPDVVKRARLEWIDTSKDEGPGLPDRNRIARLFSDRRFSGRDDIWAITLGRTIYVRMKAQIDPNSFDPHAAVGLALLAHELKHVEQYEREGTLKFYWKYVTAYATRGGYGQIIPFESEAYSFQNQVCEHLAREFASNGGTFPCQLASGLHTANLSFQLETPVVFRFPA